MNEDILSKNVFVVIECDRGCGITVVGVYTDIDAAKSVADSSHYEIHECELYVCSDE